ncbi:hypothetical protein V8C42DRAFT_342042 [Trichoderma barbatum]
MSEKKTNPKAASTHAAEPKSKALVVAKKLGSSLCSVGGKAILFFSPPGTDEERQEARERKAADKQRREEWRRLYPREWRDYIPRLPNPIGFTRISVLDELMRSPEGLSAERVRLRQRTLRQILLGQRNMVHEEAAPGPGGLYKYTTTGQVLTEGPDTMALRGPLDNQNELTVYLNGGGRFSPMFHNCSEHSEEGHYEFPQYEEDPCETGHFEIQHYHQGPYEIPHHENSQYYGVPYPEEGPYQTGRCESPYPGGGPYETGQNWSPYCEEESCQIIQHGSPYLEEDGYETGQFESLHYGGDEDDHSIAPVANSDHSSRSGEQEVESEEVSWVAIEGPENQPNGRNSEEDNDGT